MSAFTCEECDKYLFWQYGDGDTLCAACAEKRRETLPPTIEPRPGQPWQPVLGTIGGKRYGS